MSPGITQQLSLCITSDLREFPLTGIHHFVCEALCCPLLTALTGTLWHASPQPG